MAPVPPLPPTPPTPPAAPPLPPVPPAPEPSELAKLGSALGKLVAWLPARIRPTQKWVAHTVTVLLTGAAVAVLPLGLSGELNGAIVVLAGIVAHYVVPSGP